ncbi:MAG TPA: hypothetical protein PLE19_18235 [Planctomycetota bacterium]|nr:hypothetical protein [Planctomycetota bacterium]HRR81788.1 hypothetical protein [Planctomycetota bacterium]
MRQKVVGKHPDSERSTVPLGRRRTFARSIAALAGDVCRSSWADAPRPDEGPDAGVTEAAIRRCLLDGGIIEQVPGTARGNRGVPYRLTELGKKVCSMAGIPGAEPPARVSR